MGDLQLALLLLGALLIGGVLTYNWMQERAFRQRGEAAFRDKPQDVLLQPGAAPARLEPVLRAAGGAASPADPEIEFVTELRPAQPLRAEALGAALARRFEFGKPARWLGLNAQSGAWDELAPNAPGLYSSFQGLLQLCDRSGPVPLLKLSEFRDLVHETATRLGAQADCPDLDAAQGQAVALDQFCAEVDAVLALNVVSRDGAAFPAVKIGALAEAAGMELAADGAFRLLSEAGEELFALSNQEPAPFAAESLRALATRGVTLALDLPRVAQPEQAFERMLAVARQLAEGLGGNLVDDNRVALSEAGIEGIRRQLRAVAAKMLARGIAPGSPRALRLFG